MTVLAKNLKKLFGTLGKTRNASNLDYDSLARISHVVRERAEDAKGAEVIGILEQ